ncbi:MAG: DUF4861 family protein, partial [Duncaniella sp.]|nr:DUF4861 family protein [Duncaniella sp.]
NYLTLLKPDSKGHIRYTFTSTALRDKTTPARNAKEWFGYLEEWRRLLANPVKVSVKK